ncbi:ATP-grasp domain-containing protein [Faucicola mancuniensis]|uniref:ATP-grasp domain-containing protein n=1 Tax=Faucicola mancuniensis TaxID=1309795 RepID=UPI0039778614
MPTTFYLAEGQSSQRDMLLSLQQLKPHHDIQIIASHRHARPEILSCADIAYQEPFYADLKPKDYADERCEFVIQHAKAHHAKVLLTGRNCADYEPHRESLSEYGIRLLTGASSLEMLKKIDDKFAFTQHCQQHNIPVATAWQFNNTDELLVLLNQHQGERLCVKPVSGIFAQGFWKLEDVDSFEHLYLTDNKKIATEQFVNAYQNSQMVHEKPIPMLLMPYLSGREYSIDVVCERGEVMGAVTRYKEGSVQYLGCEADEMAVVVPLIATFGCDGIVSVQTKADDSGRHHVLEINSRPSGGIGYTVHSGVDLVQLAFLYFGGLIDKPNFEEIANQVTPCAVRPLMTSVKI